MWCQQSTSLSSVRVSERTEGLGGGEDTGKDRKAPETQAGSWSWFPGGMIEDIENPSKIIINKMFSNGDWICLSSLFRTVVCVCLVFSNYLPFSVGCSPLRGSEDEQ